MRSTVGNGYKLTKKLGQGAFGQVYKAFHQQQRQSFAIKFQLSDVANPQLSQQAKMLRLMHSETQGTRFTGLPKTYYYGNEGQYNILVMDLLGKSLGDILDEYKYFDIKTTLMIGIQLIERLEIIHSKKVLHRDIKPDNLVLGRGTDRKVYVIDFGLAKKFVRNDGSHIDYCDDKKLTGTARYTSLYTHLGIQQGRRDDLQGLFHVLVYFAKGKLPWQRVKAKTKPQRYQRIMELKAGTPITQLCQGLPQQFQKYIKYVRKLRFDQRPDYQLLKDLFTNCMKKENYFMDYNYCWNQPIKIIDRKSKDFGSSHC